MRAWGECRSAQDSAEIESEAIMKGGRCGKAGRESQAS